MRRLAFLFPGQGSQSVGMGADLYSGSKVAADIFDRADRELGFSLRDLCFNGPDTELRQTANTQPAIVTTSYALASAFMEKGAKPFLTAGHSVGEYAALAVAGVLPFERLVSLVRLRGNLMEQACPSGDGTMAALIGMNRDSASKLLENLELESHEIIDIAGLNNPGQVVVAGHVTAINKAIARVKEFGGRMGMPLNVSGPFHSRLMKSAEDGLSRELDSCDFQDADVPVVPNVEPSLVKSSAVLKSCLMSQLTRPVLWEQSVAVMVEAGVEVFVEFGSGNVLAGMLKKIDRNLEVLSISDMPSLHKALEVSGL
jgi:[acyl-carrier-protein] S-malonyltransferase